MLEDPETTVSPGELIHFFYKWLLQVQTPPILLCLLTLQSASKQPELLNRRKIGRDQEFSFDSAFYGKATPRPFF
jgi:hypothetical protein